MPALLTSRWQKYVRDRQWSSERSIAMAMFHWLTICARHSICENPLQPRNDLLEVVYRYAEPLLGETVAESSAGVANFAGGIDGESPWCRFFGTIGAKQLDVFVERSG